MVIQCPECQARFKMADEKARNGVKVRCSRCQHVFPVQVPDVVPESAAAVAAPELQAAVANGSPAVHTPPAPAAAADNREEVDEAFFSAPSQPTAAPSAAGIDDFDLADFSVDTETEAGPATAASGADELDLGEFNLDAVPQFASEDTAADDFDFDDSSAASEFAFDAAEEREPFDFSAPPAADGLSFDTPAADDLSFDAPAGSDFSFDEEPTAFSADANDQPEEGEDGFPLPEGDEFSFGDLSPESAFAIDPPAAAESEAAESWQAGDGPNDEFDFASAPASGADEFDFSNLSFGDENPVATPAPPLSPAVSETLPPLAAAPAPLPVQESAAPRAEPPAAPPVHDEEPLYIPPPPRRKSALSGPRGLLVLLLLLLGGGGAYVLSQDGVPDLAALFAGASGETPAPVAAGQIRVTDLSGSFVSNAEAGQLFVIQGRVTNDYPEARSAIAVKGVLYGQGGQALMQQTVFSGNMLDEKALRTLPFAKIEESMNNQFGDSLSNLNVASGKSLPFTIVFRNLPTGLAEYTAEVTDSKPGAN